MSNNTITIGTIGAGNIAKAFAGHFAKAGHKVIISNSRGAASLAEIAKTLGNNVQAGTVEEAAQADMVLIAVPFNEVSQALKGLPVWNNRIVLDATNAIVFPEFKPADLGDTTSSEIVATLVPGARLIKAFNTLLAATLAADPHEAGGNRVIFYSGDDADAKATFGQLLQQVGFAGIDLGSLATGGRLQQFGGALVSKNLVRLK